MNSLSLGLSVPMLLYLASVATASLLVTGTALLAVRGWPSAPLPMRHAILVSALVVAAISPLALGVMAANGVSLIRLSEPSQEAVFAAQLLPVATENQQDARLPLVSSEADLSGNESRPPTERVVSASVATVVPVKTIEPTPMRESIELWSWRAVGSVLALAWLVGCAVCLLWLGIGLAQVRRLVRNSRPVTDPRILKLAEEVSQQMGLDVAPRTCISGSIDVPLSIGLFRPHVVLPNDTIETLLDDQLRGLLTHEFGHITRRDHLVGLLQRLSLALYWWNPLVRNVSATISAVREQICDDLATQATLSDDSYAAMLVDFAGRATGGRSLPATIGMFDGSRREFSRRVERLLDMDRSRATSLDRRLKVFSAAIAIALLVLAGATSIQMQSSAAEPESAAPPTEAVQNIPTANVDEFPAVKWPKVLRGVVQDEAGQPVEGAKVRLDLEKIHEYSIGRWDETVSSQELVTGSDGEYRFDTAQYPAMKHRPFMLMMSVTADGYADTKTWNWYARRDPTVDERWAEVKLWPGRIVRGRVVDHIGRPVPGAVIKAGGDFGINQFGRNMAWNPRKTDEDGNFTISVPSQLEGAIELWIVSRDWAPQRVSVPKQGEELADVRLQPGARVQGKVTREDGSPIAGTVVVATNVDDGTLKNMGFPVTLAVKTNAQGQYQLPPIAGIYKLYLSQASETDDRLVGNFVVGGGPPPRVTPVKVAASGHEEPQIDFHAGPTLTVRGTVRWADRSPVAECQVQASFLPPDFGTGIWLDDTRTDAEGKYTVELPMPIDAISIHVSGAFDADRVWHFGQPAEGVEAEQASLQFIRLGRLTEDRDGVDWVLKSREEIDGLQPVESKPKDAAVLELEKLERRYAAKEQELRDEMDQAKTAEEQSKLLFSFDPRVLFVNDYLELETRHPNTDVGLAALAKVDRFAASVTDSVPKVPAARRAMYERLMSHYLEHPGLDIVFTSVSAGAQTELGPELLRKAAIASPHRHVQAAAIYWLAKSLQSEADSVALLKIMLAELENQSPRNQPYLELLMAQLAERDQIDPAESNREAVQLARRLEREFADVEQPQRVFENCGLFRLATKDQLSSMEPKPTYGELARRLMFDLERLQIGLPAPPIDGSDRDGKRVTVTNFTGKVTVLAFTVHGQEQLEASLAELAQLPGGERLQNVVIHCDNGLVPAINRDEPAPARFIDERPNGPVATQWAVNTWPTIFVVDGNGIICGRRLQEVPMQLVGELLKSAAAETDRVFVPKSEHTR